MKRVALLALAATAGCSLNLGVPADLTITCTTNEECPTGSICDTNVGKCVATETPTLRVEVPNQLVTRYTRQVPFQIDMVSANGSATFDVQIEFRLLSDTDETWLPLTLTAASTQPTGLTGSPSGTRYQFTWDALTDATDANGLTLARVDLNGDGQISDPIVSTADVIIRAVARNASASVESVPAESAPFTIGNAPPTATILATFGESGVINVVVGLSDTSADTCGFELQFRGPDGVWRTTALEYGTTEALGCLATTTLDASVGWNSRAAYYDPAVQPPGTPQGIGNRTIPNLVDSTRILLRARAYDRAEASETEQHWGLWSPPHVLTRVVNQTAPIIVDAAAPRSGITGGTSPVHIRYTLVDAESDPTDVTIEYSNDGGGSFLPCQEYPYALSEGTSQLVTAPLGEGGTGGGVEHLFTWDPSHVSPQPPHATIIRIRANDGHNPPVANIFGLGAPAAPSGVPPHDAFAHTLFTRNLYNSNGTTQACCVTDVAMADFNNDGVKDLVFAKPGSDALTIARNTGATVPWAETYLTGVVNLVVAGNFLNDPTKQSILGIASSGAATFWSGNGAVGFAVDTSFNVGATPIDAIASDVNNDGYADLVVARDLGSGNYTVDVHLNTKVAATRFSNTPTYSKGYASVLSMAVGDLDTDGFADIAVVTQNRDGYVLAGNGSGQFAQIGTFTGENGYQDESLAIGEVNGDGFPDLINASGYSMIYNLGSGGPGMVTYERVNVDGLPSSNDYGRVADFNGDGLTDLVGSNILDGHFTLVMPTVDAGTGEVSAQVGAVPITNLGMFADDLDGDGIGELVAFTGNGTGIYSVVLIDGPAVVGGQMFRQGPSIQPDRGGTPVVGNFDADGVLDLLYLADTITLHRGIGGAGAGDGFFGPGGPVGFIVNEDNLAIVDAKAVDLNGDGALDVVFLMQSQVTDTVTHFATKLGWLMARPQQGVADGRFAQPQFLFVGESTRQGPIAIADFDVDGLPDAAYAYTDDIPQTNWNLGVAFNRGALGFTQQDATYNTGAGLTYLAVAYIGADALPDLVATINANNQARFFVSSAAPVNRANPFPAVSNLTTSFNPVEAQVADLNWDGVTDVLLRYSTTIEMHNGIAAGGFGGTLSYFPNSQVFEAQYFDASLDGYNDLVFFGIPSSDVSAVSAGAAPGGVPNNTFAAVPQTFPAPAFGSDAIFVRDLNCDGVTDYVIALADQNVQPMARSRDMFTPVLSLSVPPYNGRHTSMLAGLGLSGVASHPWHVANGPPCAEQTRWEDDLRAARAQQGLSPRFRVLSPARWLGETVRYKKVAVGDEVRFQRSSRFSPALNLATDGAPRGLVATLRVAPGRRASVVPAKVRVYQQHDVLAVAADITQDSQYGAANASELLPQVLTSRGLTDVVRRRWTWTAVPLDADNNLTTGTGKRFIYDATKGLADILTDEGGLYVLVEDP